VDQSPSHVTCCSYSHSCHCAAAVAVAAWCVSLLHVQGLSIADPGRVFAHGHAPPSATSYTEARAVYTKLLHQAASSKATLSSCYLRQDHQGATTATRVAQQTLAARLHVVRWGGTWVGGGEGVPLQVGQTSGGRGQGKGSSGGLGGLLAAAVARFRCCGGWGWARAAGARQSQDRVREVGQGGRAFRLLPWVWLAPRLGVGG
jgi:hypothetical protein